ncbi:MAG TPA: tetratricopeptide repeat protein, partial [Agitococcus sp.]|nr:tetratricopeptide repeat protein [Agitococcus sp.]
SRSHVEQLRLALNKQPEHPQITFNLWIALIRLGNLEQKLQRYEIAFDYYKESLDIASDIYNKNPMSNQSYFSYISSLNNLADLSYEVHNYKQALDLYENSLVLVKDWLKMSVNKQEPLNRLSFILLGIARIYNSQGDFSMSWQYATELLNAILSLQKNIDNYEIERRLSMAYQLLGDIKINLGDMDSGLNYYQKSLYITESIFDGDINNPKNIRDMMIILSKIAKVFDVLKSYEKVEKYYQQAIMLASKQCELIGSTPKALGDKFIINRNLLEFKLKIKYIDGSINLSDDIIKTALQLYNLSSKSLQAIEDLLEAYQLRLALEKQLNPNIEPLELLQKIADLEQQRQQLLNNP